MRLRTEMFDTTGGKRIDACRADSEHDAACAHALMLAMGELEAHHRGWHQEIRGRASELMREWGFDSGEVTE